MAEISVIGTGFIAKGFIDLLLEHPNHKLGKILTRTNIKDRTDLGKYAQYITNNIDDVIKNSELIVETSGDAIYACDTINTIVTTSNIPIITMNSEFHITVGSYFINKGFITEAEGDQPGCIAALHEEAVAMGFKPIVYGNMKGFLNENPSEEDMKYWGAKSGISLDMVTSFTDGTKVQIEQTLVANKFNATIAKNGLLGLKKDDLKLGADQLGKESTKIGAPISDYLLSPKLNAGVFIVAEHRTNQIDHLRYYKLGDGPYYTLEKPYHVCHMEIFKTINRVLKGGGILLDNSLLPTISTCTIAKRDLNPGDYIKKGIGSFDVRGIAIKIKEHKNHIPIGLMGNITIKKPVKAGEMLTFDDVDVVESLAVIAWKEIEKNVISSK